MQIGLVGFTISSFLLTSFKYPQYGLLAALLSQPFWIYSSYRAWKEARQLGVFINTLVIAGIVVWGVINYWLL